MNNINPIYLEESFAKEAGKAYLIMASILGLGGAAKHYSPRVQERRMIQKGLSELGGKIKDMKGLVKPKYSILNSVTNNPAMFNLSNLSPEAKYATVNYIASQWSKLATEMEKNPELRKVILSNNELHQMLKEIAYNSRSRTRRVNAYAMLRDIESMQQ